MILVMGGTADGRELVRRIAASGRRVIASAATGYGARLLREQGQKEIQARRLDAVGLAEFIRRHGIDALVDATHPYAEAASRAAIAACRATGCRYLRYERPPVQPDDFPGALIRAAGYREAAEWARTHGDGPALLTTGSKTLGVFAEILGVERLVVRVLPTAEALRQCQRLGLAARQIVAMQGPFSHALNKALIEHFGIRLLISKDGGEVGGMPEKLSAAAECAVPVVLIDRPAVDYPNRFRRMDDIFLALGGEE
ncbi:MAG: precorrin-6A reductase [Candidatus Accumulibacter sp.]|jgi:precorrin-6A/cobalt-precorrin-6A reductase|nr:precorrin-6A reductase [Accumulibacter sp.]